jgi:prepilin-type processing-associated H-X9-DG protein
MNETAGLSSLFANPLGCLALPFVAAAILFPVFTQAKKAAEKTSCLSNVKQLALASIIYASDYDDKLPAASAWESRTYPYCKSQALYTCPEVRKEGKEHGFAFRKAVSGKSMVAIEKPAEEVMILESKKLGKNTYGDFELLPKPGRHEGANNLAYTDGHAKSLRD